MPAPKKLDLIPEEVRGWLREELTARGFADIIDVTEALNFRLEEAGLEIRIGKSAVGDYSKALKDQREAFSIAETLLADMDIEAEGELHKVLMQMIATSAVHMINAVREKDEHLDPKDLMSLGRMLKDLMSSSGMREKLLSDERDRVAREATEAAEAAANARFDAAIDAAEQEARGPGEKGLSATAVATLRREFLGLRS
ncbi:phage protein Gp27 family protein [Sagittula sp. S175]|uniref:phage protein Gp27 family protein n=1 Tax=Sagittula sp. S175 TaxID=3415129 RepID=UPI003C7D2213